MHEYVVTFTNAASAAVTDELTTVRVTVRTTVEPDDVADDADVADLIVQYAQVAWTHDAELPFVDWTLADAGWDAALLTLPDGDVLDLS